MLLLLIQKEFLHIFYQPAPSGGIASPDHVASRSTAIEKQDMMTFGGQFLAAACIPPRMGLDPVKEYDVGGIGFSRCRKVFVIGNFVPIGTGKVFRG